MYVDFKRNKYSRNFFNFVAVILTFAIFTLSTGAVYDKQLKKITVVKSDAFGGDYDTKNYFTKSTAVGEFLSENNIAPAEDEVLNVSVTDRLFGGEKIVISKFKRVFVWYCGKLEVVKATKNSVGDVLRDGGFDIAAADIVQPSAESEVYDNMLIKVDSVRTDFVIEEFELPFEEVLEEDNTLPCGIRQIKTHGKNGKKRVISEVTLQNGVEQSREQVCEVVLAQPTAQVVSVGTKQDNYINDMKYSRRVDVIATAYTATGNLTATGRVARVGVIAVDPKVIPLNSTLYVVAQDGSSWCYGVCVAGDTGGKIKGNRIDLYYDTREECINFGKCPATVYILD